MAIVHACGFRPRLYDESPWYAPIAPYLARFDGLARFPSADELSALYAERAEVLGLPPLRFVAVPRAKKKRRGRAPIELSSLYEGRIVERGEVPTRVDDWHDLFNALAFIRFPRAKRALHTRQYVIVKSRLAPGATRLPNARTREQDALSLFDEGGLCVATSATRAPALEDAPDEVLRAAVRAGSARVVPFGHALHEHLVAGLPCPLATAFVVTLPEAAHPSDDLYDALDVALAAAIADARTFQVPSSARGTSLDDLAADLAAQG